MKRYTFSFLLSFLTIFSAFSQANVVIYEVFAGGGNIGSYYKNDYVMLYNKGNVSQSLVGWSLQKAQNASSNSWKVFPLTGSIGANQYYLIKFDGNTNGLLNPLPTPDFDVMIFAGKGGITYLDVDLAVSGGKLALSSSTTAFNTTTPTGNVVDFLGYGTANAAEGTAATAMDATHALRRVANGQDTNNNSVDFTKVSPNPINIALPVTLTYFRAVVEEHNQVAISWETASEITSSHFVIERSADALNYEELTKVTAQGESSEVHQYRFVDMNPLIGVSYYRLRQVDLDSAVVEYRPIAAYLGGENLDEGIYPNPLVSDNFFIKLNETTNPRIEIIGMDGLNIDFRVNPSSPEFIQIIPDIPLKDGIYFVYIQTEGVILPPRKLVVTRF